MIKPFKPYLVLGQESPKKVTGLSINETRKIGIIGCFLGQHLKVTRQCMDVIDRASHIVQPFKSGKYTKQEDEIILEEVKRSGNKESTWRELAPRLNRDPSRWIDVRKRYMYTVDRQR